MARHVHANIIHQWAEGAEIECCTAYNEWVRLGSPSWFEGAVYRIAQPKPRHKLARMATQRSTEYFVVAQSNSDVLSIEANPEFVEWVK